MHSFQHYGTVSEKVARLRGELQKIDAENRRYSERKHHGEVETVQHLHRRVRILEIQSELEAMMQRRTA